MAYLEAHTEIRDVLISGGDPLLMSDEPLNISEIVSFCGKRR